MPQGQTIWNAFVNERPVKPVTEADGRIRLPLVLSQEVFPVRLTLVHEQVSLLPLNHQSLKLAEVDIPVSEIVWEVLLPQDRHVYFQSGTLEKTPTPRAAHFPVTYRSGLWCPG